MGVRTLGSLSTKSLSLSEESPLTAENGITDNCSAVFAFSVTNNVTKTLFKKEVICRKQQVALIVCELEEDLQQKKQHYSPVAEMRIC